MRNHNSRKHLPGIRSFQFLIPQFLCGDFFNSIDPTRDIGRQFCCDAQRGIFYNDVVGSNPRTKGST